MLSRKLKPVTIEEYIDDAPAATQKRLLQIHERIRKAAPGASEAIKWAMPAYSYKKILVAFAVFKNHIGFYRMPSAIKAFAKELVKYHTAKGSIQFPLDEPLPLGLISRIVKFRVKESKEGIMKWKS